MYLSIRPPPIGSQSSPSRVCVSSVGCPLPMPGG